VIGRYHPKEDPSLIEINSEARPILALRGRPSPPNPFLKLLKITGDWQKFKGMPGAEGRLKVAPAKPTKLELFNRRAGRPADGAPTTEAAKPKKKSPAKEDGQGRP